MLKMLDYDLQAIKPYDVLMDIGECALDAFYKKCFIKSKKYIIKI